MTKELHPSILHINAKNLSEQTIKMVNKMVEKAIEMKSLQTEFEATGYSSWINSDLYPDGKIHTKEYTEWLEKKSADLTAENLRLREALALSKETIKLWACMGMSESKEEETWRLYQNSPEMKVINKALK